MQPGLCSAVACISVRAFTSLSAQSERPPLGAVVAPQEGGLVTTCASLTKSCVIFLTSHFRRRRVAPWDLLLLRCPARLSSFVLRNDSYVDSLRDEAIRAAELPVAAVICQRHLSDWDLVFPIAVVAAQPKPRRTSRCRQRRDGSLAFLCVAHGFRIRQTRVGSRILRGASFP